MSASINGCVPVFLLCSNATNYDIHTRVPSRVAIASSAFSCFGSAAIVISFVAVKEFRTVAQKIITLLAVADFITSFGYIVGSVNYLNNWNRSGADGCQTFNDICKAQSFLTTWSSICSQAWTCLLAAYFLLITFHPLKLGARAFALSNVLVWGLPLVPVASLLGTNHLGYSRMTAAGWCFVNDQDRELGLTIILTLLGGKFTEIVTYIIVVVAYVLTMCRTCKVKILKNASCMHVCASDVIVCFC